MFTLYRIDFWSSSEIDPIQCEQCSQRNRTRLYRFGVELFSLYRIDMLHICFCLAKETLPRVQESDNEIPFQKWGDPQGFAPSHHEQSVPKSFRYGTYHFWNRSIPAHNCHRNCARPAWSNVNRRPIRYSCRVIR